MVEKRTIVIGSNCFTGSHIVDALLEDPDHRVIGASRSPEYHDLFLPYKGRSPANFIFCQIDLVHDFKGLVSLIEEVKPQVVIHVAALSEVAISHEFPVEYFETNTLGVVRLCNFLRRSPFLERYIHISSAEVFGTCESPRTEGEAFNPSTPYAASKAAADMYLKTLIDQFAFPATLIRSTNVYGKHQQLYKIIPRTVIYLRLGKTIELHGGGKAVKSFIHIRDVVRGVLLAMERGKPGTYHFTAFDDQTVTDVVRQICTWMGHDFEHSTRTVEERRGQDARYWLDCGKAETDLCWSPRIPFDEGVKEVIAWIVENWERVRHQPLHYIHRAGVIRP